MIKKREVYIGKTGQNNLVLKIGLQPSQREVIKAFLEIEATFKWDTVQVNPKNGWSNPLTHTQALKMDGQQAVFNGLMVKIA